MQLADAMTNTYAEKYNKMLNIHLASVRIYFQTINYYCKTGSILKYRITACELLFTHK